MWLLDRLARSIKDLQDIVYSLNQRGITLKATEQPVDTRTAAGKAFLDMLGVFAEFETNLCRERQLEGIAAAKARGVYRGRKSSIDPAEVYRLYVDENINGLILQYFSKRTDFSSVTEQEIRFVINTLNNRPRKTLG
ncbi:hypothetical protein XBKQ1_420005 [Xenorhabdus bovienii str. kraussei Quebec]|uniref:Resolvase/invertase-type recombinase catalytic domain-containing protein n=1 Tax=Xenorhabdus bovienii str. kraussei Quebec TaxID=1398203 RepID=A0A077PK67_XENBV|nr:hypothetical protein XBKQ1_420005 [Xenorhabdus bovienii str. kraussei Quebec]